MQKISIRAAAVSLAAMLILTGCGSNTATTLPMPDGASPVVTDSARTISSTHSVILVVSAEIVTDAVFESRDDGHEGGGIDLRHANVNSEQGTLHLSDRGQGRHRSTLAMLFHVLQIPLFEVRLRPFRTAMASCAS